MTLATAARDVQCVQLFLPLHSPDEARARRLLADVRKELTDRFGGVAVSCNRPCKASGRIRKATSSATNW